MRQFLVRVLGDEVQMFDDGKQVCGLVVGERTDRSIVEFIAVVAEGVEPEVVEHLRRDEEQGVGEVVGTVYRVHDVSREDDGQVVFVMCDDPHVVLGSGAAAEDERQNDVLEHEIFIVAEETWHLTHNPDVGVLNGLQQRL